LTPDPLDIHFPIRRTITPKLSKDIKVNMPPLKPPTDVDGSYDADFEDYAAETHEWFSLIQLDSPRINPDDKIDSFMSRYVPPGDSSTVCKLVKITWQGFLAPSWAHKTFVQVLLATPQDVWFAYCVAGFVEGDLGASRNCTILKVPDTLNEYVLWDIM
jgi:ribonuclease P/MRP protein subunit RPP40